MTLKARVIPCLDVKDGRVVKGVNFVNLVDAGDPVEAAKAYDAAGADELCFLDITASSDNRDTIFDVVARTAEQCFMPVTVGGGVRAIADIRKLLLCGADKVSINSAAVNNPDFVAEAADKFGNQCIERTGQGVVVQGRGDVGGDGAGQGEGRADQVITQVRRTLGEMPGTRLYLQSSRTSPSVDARVVRSTRTR